MVALNANHTMAQKLSMVVNEGQDGWNIHLAHEKFVYNNPVNATTGLVPNEVHTCRLPRLLLPFIERSGIRGQQSLARDQLEYCSFTIDRQRLALE